MTERPTTLIEQSERRLSDGLDYYKLTMGQLALAKHPDAAVTFTLKNRAAQTPLSPLVAPADLQERLTDHRQNGFASDEIDYLRSLRASNGEPRFDDSYLSYLETLELPEVQVRIDPETKDIAVETTGEWAAVSLWETVVMSELNELYYQGKISKEALSLDTLYDEGDRRLSEKIAVLQSRSDIKIVDFGTRRRFSADWHRYVVGRLVAEVPDNLLGTSNPWLAKEFGIPPIGTYAHEMPMVYAALADKATGQPLTGHGEMLRDWREQYKGDLSVALTDTFTSDFFFADFGEHGANNWNGLRHDSGDPIAFGERAIEFYEHYGIDPLERTLVFSDGLDIDHIITLSDHFKDRIRVVFGWGTTLTNDLGLPANNFVMKATAVNGAKTVKLSDAAGKHTGSEDDVARYQQEVYRYFTEEGAA